MTKADLIDEVSRLAELTRKDSEVIVETIFDSIVRSLRVGDKIEIRGFGSFTVRPYKAYSGRNPRTGAPVPVPPKRLPFFKVGKELKELVLASGSRLMDLPGVGPYDVVARNARRSADAWRAGDDARRPQRRHDEQMRPLVAAVEQALDLHVGLALGLGVPVAVEGGDERAAAFEVEL